MDHPTFIVTGASKGLGAAIASIAADRGAQVVLTARSKDALELQARNIEQRGGKALAIPGDISRFEDCKNVIDQTVQAFGRIDALINNAAVAEPFGTVSEVNLVEWAHTQEINVLGPIIMCQLAIPHLRQTNGRVINITSHGAESNYPGGSAYFTSKAALNRFSKVLAAEEAALTVILISPGPIDTPMHETIRVKGKGKLADELYQIFVDQFEQGRLVPAEKPAQAIVNLSMVAPIAWSGEFLDWFEERVQALDKAR